jgi:glycosyltransferase involved in cell wall biosynthesis
LKIAFVVHRYGLEVTGGAEFLCRLLAEHLSKYWTIEVFTTCAIDYISWENAYPEGREQVNGVTVWRFPVESPRNIKIFDQLTQKIYGSDHSIDEEERWMELQGPCSSSLVYALQERASGYDFFIFVSYLYAHTYYGLTRVKEKAILIPLAHDEPPLYLKIFNELFLLPKAIIFSTPEEAELVWTRFNNNFIPSETIGIGIDPPKSFNSQRFRVKYGLEGEFIIYVGRIDKSKGCEEIVQYFLRYHRETNSPLKLLLIGNAVMPIPSHPSIIYLGQLSEEDKFDALQAAAAAVMPSPYESFSIFLLESWLALRPVIVNVGSPLAPLLLTASARC